MRRLIAPIVASLFTLPAFADCPTGPEILKTGLYVETQNSGLMRMLSDGLGGINVEIYNREAPETVILSRTAYGIYPLAAGQMNGKDEPTIGITLAYASSPPEPTPGMEWKSDFTTSDVTVPEGHFKLSAGEISTQDIAGCPLRVLPVSIVITFAFGDTPAEISYLPDLGLGLQIIRDADGKAEPLTISTTKPDWVKLP